MKRPEQALQKQIVTLLRLAGAPPARWTAIQPQARGKIQGAIMKAMGVNAGWPDLVFILDSGRIGGIELKAGRGASSMFQQRWAHEAIQAGAYFKICRGVEEVFATLRHWGFEWASRVHFTENGAAVVRSDGG